MSSVYDKSKKMMIVQLQIAADDFLTHSLQIVEGDFSDQKIFAVCDRFICLDRLTFALIVSSLICVALSCSYHRMICAGFKTIKSFVK
jgi:hypothetical protein